jgi:hypothetical protein
MAKYDDKEYWRDKSAWHFTDLTIDGRKLIFLLEALDQYGERKEPSQWPLIDSVYKDPSLYSPSHDGYGQGVHALLHKWCYSFDYTFIPKYSEIDYGYVLEDTYKFKNEYRDLALSVLRFCKPINQKRAEMHADILDKLTEAFASGELTAYRVELITEDMAALAPSAWHGAKPVTDKRFYFGEIALDEEGQIRDAEKGPYQLYVDEAEFTRFLDRTAPRPRTLEEWLEARIRHYDGLPKSVCDTVKTCYKKVLVDLQTETFELDRIWEKFETAFQKVKPELRRFGKKGRKTGQKSPVEVRKS